MLMSRVRPNLFFLAGLFLGMCGLAFLLWLYFPVVQAEWQYRFVWSRQPLPVVVSKIGSQDGSPDSTGSESPVSQLEPVSTQFGLLIPKLHISAPVIGNVDPNNETLYQKALQNGVAHAAGSSIPSSPGTTFLFAHSSANQLEAIRYNAIFYLLNKLVVGDEIVVYYADQAYTYKVKSLEVVEPDQVQYAQTTTGPQQLTLMTCTPMGTALRRLLVHAELTTKVGN